uniref:Coiled-coil domain-containing protein 50 n=2 Tax=Lygus hesperus TaxID=30085 RepID=A0A146LK49_LYGHE
MSASNIQCQIGHMAGNKPISDTMPKRGKVTEMCKEWLVHEDGALAYQLQQEEVEKHYSGNKSRNAIVREDFPMAKDAQRRAQDEAMADYYRQTKLLEEEDERIAREIAERLEREEAEKMRRLEVEDQRMARIMQERDKRAKLLSRQGDMNAVGLPLPDSVVPDGAYGGVAHRPVTRGATGVDARVYENLPPPLPSHHRGRRTMVDVEQQFRRMQLEDDVAEPIWPPPPDPDQITKANQEKSDEELAKRLQLEEQSAELDMVDRDRMLAIEVQDLELAKMLQEKEKARLRRAKEKARAKALAKKQMEENGQQHMPTREGTAEDPLALQLPAEQMVNIATAIDPTYVPPKAGQSTPPRSANSTLSSCGSNVGALRHSPCYLPPDNILLDDTVEDSPPYMPVQGQRRTSSIEKKKKKSKDGDCKQQ